MRQGGEVDINFVLKKKCSSHPKVKHRGQREEVLTFSKMRGQTGWKQRIFRPQACFPGREISGKKAYGIRRPNFLHALTSH